MRRHYFAGQSDSGSESSHGFANDWTVYAFESKQARDDFVETSRNISTIAIKKKEVTKHAANYSLTRNEYIAPKPFTGEYWGIVPLDVLGGGPDGCTGIVTVCGGRYGIDGERLHK